MKRLAKPWRFAALLAVIMLVAAACGGADDTTTTAAEAATTTAADTGATTTTGAEAAGYCADSAEGPLLWTHEQEPSSWNYWDATHQLTVTSWLTQAMWDGLYGETAAVTFYPEMLAEEAVLTVNDDGSVTISYKLRDGLVWSDGVPFSPSEIQAFQDLIMATDADGEFVMPNTDRPNGHNSVTSIDITSETEFDINMSTFFAGWQGMFNAIPPMHVWEGVDPADIVANWSVFEVSPGGDKLPATGPMKMEEWNPGVNVVMSRNDLYHGSVSPDVTNQGGLACVNGMIMTLVPDTDAQINALRAGEAHLLHVQPQLQFEDLNADPRFISAVRPGAVWEHWGLNLNNVHLADPLVREAMAYAFDKAQVVEALYERVFGPGVLAEDGLWNTFFMPNQVPWYEDHGLDTYAGNNVAEAEVKLQEAGYTKAGDGIYEHPERGRLSLRVGTTGGNELRELQQQLLQAQFAAAGIEIVIDNVPGSAYFAEVPFSAESMACAASGGAEGDCGIWDITQFAWLGGPWPGSAAETYRTENPGGPYGHQNAEYDAKAEECNATTDEAERNACYNILDRYATTLDFSDQGLFMLPITQKPDTYFYDSEALSAAAISPDTDNGGPIANIVDFKLAG